jgi:drug/metabolite transporter (DMT)-like permease
MKKETLGTLLAIITAVFSGIAIPANKVFVVNMDPAVFTAVRSVIIGIIFLVLSLWFNKNNVKGKKKRFAASWKYLAAIAVIGGAVAFLFYFTGLKLTTAGHAAFLHKTLPLYVAVLAFIFLKERITKKYLAAMLLMVIGTIAIYSTSINPAELWLNPQFGDMLVISATFLWAIENVIARKAMVSGETNFVVSFARMFFGGLILFGVVLLTGKTGALLSLTAQQTINIGISTILLFAYVFFYYWSLRLINVSKAAVMLLLAPVVSLVLGIVFLHEPAPLTQLAGSAVILIGVYLIAGLKSEQKAI